MDAVRLNDVAHEGSHGNATVLDLRMSEPADGSLVGGAKSRPRLGSPELMGYEWIGRGVRGQVGGWVGGTKIVVKQGGAGEAYVRTPTQTHAQRTVWSARPIGSKNGTTGLSSFWSCSRSALLYVRGCAWVSVWVGLSSMVHEGAAGLFAAGEAPGVREG